MQKLNESDLRQFTGTTQYFRHWLGFNYTDGVHFMAEKGGAYWLIDAIGSYQDRKRNEPFQIWTLTVNKDKSAILEMKEDSNQPTIIKQVFSVMDFPLKKIELYFINGVLLLPSEY